jgi:CO/xanthine dehydrogenase Mo-binding subunit
MDDFHAPMRCETEEQFAVGQPVPRAEDPVLLRGKGRFADDISLPRQAYAVMVRSHLAHGIIRGIDTAAARAMPDVLAIYIADDLARGGIGPLPPRQVIHNRDGTPMLSPTRYALPRDKVRHVGEAVAAVIADTLALAEDAAEMVAVEVDPLPVVTDPADADRPGAPILYDEVPQNVGCDFTLRRQRQGRRRLRRRHPRHPAPSAQQPDRRQRDGAARRARSLRPGSSALDLACGCQGVFGCRTYVAQVLGVGRDQIRVLTERVGGSCGMKQPTYADYYCILHAARELRPPVKWTDDRSGSFVSDTHGRDADITAELALDADGNILAVRLTGHGNLGATYGAPGPPTRNAVRNTLGVYRTPLIEVSTRCVFTNTTPVGAYRGAGRPEANYYMERLVETAAAEIGIDRVAVEAADKCIEAGRQIAAHVLEAAAADIEFRAGRFVIAGTDRSVGIIELAAKLRNGLELPAGLPPSLDVATISDGPPSTFPNGCHIAEVEIDPETGLAEVVRYSFVNDFGLVINPLLVAGQAHGGIVQGIGQALRAHTVYDAHGQLLTGSYMDYPMPAPTMCRCSRAPAIRCRPGPIRWASRAAARPAAPAPCRR